MKCIGLWVPLAVNRITKHDIGYSKNSIIDITNSDHLYFLGFAVCDGTLASYTRNRGRFSIELHERDKNVLLKFQKMLNVKSTISYRTRKTNFKEMTSCVLSIFALPFRQELISFNYMCGKKSENCSPLIAWHDINYIRGMIDADGAVGVTTRGIPFVSFCTKSEKVKKYYVDFLKNIDILVDVGRNKRDHVYNIMVSGKNGLKLIHMLYSDATISVERKHNMAISILASADISKKYE